MIYPRISPQIIDFCLIYPNYLLDPLNSICYGRAREELSSRFKSRSKLHVVNDSYSCVSSKQIKWQSLDVGSRSFSRTQYVCIVEGFCGCQYFRFFFFYCCLLSPGLKTKFIYKKPLAVIFWFIECLPYMVGLSFFIITKGCLFTTSQKISFCFFFKKKTNVTFISRAGNLWEQINM